MNTRSSSWTQKAPRTLEDAFGPYCGTHFEEKYEMDWQDVAVTVGSVIVFTVFVALLAWGVV